MANTEFIDEHLITFMLFYASAGVVMSTLGAIGNTINIKTFISMGLTDGVTVSLLVLSFTDLVFLVARLCRAVSAGLMAGEVIRQYLVWFPVDPTALHFYFAHVGHILYTYIITITTFLAIARCMCVLKPLSFKYVFTTQMSLLILGGSLVFCVVCLCPIFAFMGITKSFDERINATRGMLLIVPGRELARHITRGIRDIGLAVPSEVIVVICVVIKIRCLKASSKFRHRSQLGSMTNTSLVQVFQSSMMSLSCEGFVPNKEPIPAVSNTRSPKLSSKDLNAVRQVFLISVVFITCNTPKIIMTIAGFQMPEFSLGGTLENIFMSLSWLTDLFQIINASAGLIIYYKYNSKFRKTLCPIR
ncbi:hypothetical protein BsWGS_20992 [Bradybaena similaris]